MSDNEDMYDEKLFDKLNDVIYFSILNIVGDTATTKEFSSILFALMNNITVSLMMLQDSLKQSDRVSEESKVLCYEHLIFTIQKSSVNC